MAVANDNLERDVRLGHIYAAAGDAANGPPAALDASILAAARREVGAGPAVLGAAPSARQLSKRWFVPVSIAAVLTLSVSLVSLVRVEKGDDLAQAPASEPKAPKPASTSVPPVAAQERDGKGGTGEAAVAMKDAAPTPEPAKPATAPDMPKVVAKQQAEPAEPTRKEAGRSADADLAKITVPGTPVAQAEKRVAQAFPKADTEASAPVARPSVGATANTPARDAEAARDAVAVRAPPVPPPAASTPSPVVAESPRRADNTVTSSTGIRGPDGAGTAAPPPPPAIAAAKPAPAQSVVKSTEDFVEGRVVENARRREERTAAPGSSAASPTTPATPAVRQVLRGAGSPSGAQATGSRPLWLAGLDNQPADKWLEKLAELRREGRAAEAEQLLAEFRRRFPDHPASR